MLYAMNVSLTPELETMVAEKVKSGLYNSASEVVREGLRLVREQDQLREIKLEELRREIQIGIDQADAGQVAPLDVEALKVEARRRRDEK